MKNFEIANTLNPLELVASFDCSIDHISIDSRSMVYPQSTIYIAIVGERNNGHQFMEDCYKQGVRNFIISDPSYLQTHNDANYYLVKDTMVALQLMATYKRRIFTKPVIAITGSNGKTIVKDWASYLLSEKFSVCKSPKSYNSQVGVPLSVWQLSNEFDLGVFEAGISQTGEMKHLHEIILPTIGVFTNIGHAHDSGFTSTEEKIREKLQLFIEAEWLIYCKDNPTVESTIHTWFQQASPQTKLFSWSTKLHADLVITKKQIQATNTFLQAVYKNQFIELTIPFIDEASIENVIQCWCLLLHFQFEQNDIQQRVSQLCPVGMRLELKEAINQSVLIDDTYTNDVDSLRIGIDYLHSQPGVKKGIVLSDIQQSVLSDDKLYEQVASILKRIPLHRIITVGKNIGAFTHLFVPKPLHFDSTDALIQDGCLSTIQDETLLLKGARSFEFEKISRLLQYKNHETILEVNLTSLVQNYHSYKRQLSKDVKVMAMVKAFSYGSGSYEVASVLEYNRVDYFAVAYIDEGIELRKRGIKKPIMVMNVNFDSLSKLKEYNLEPEVYSIEKFQKLAHWSKQQNLPKQGLNIHIKLDTGMHRLGFDASQIDELLHLLRMNQQLQVATVFSHLVASDDELFDEFTKHQIEHFQHITQQIEVAIGYSTIKHILNSGGISRFKQAHFEMVRLGIGMYGISSNREEKKTLENVCTLKTTISQLRVLNQGDTVGYSRKGILRKPSTIATIPIGYADGFRRSLGNGNYSVLVNGQECKTIGNICMDMCMIDVSDVNCKEGDEVIIFGQQKPITTYAEAMQTIAYEALTSVSERVKRIYLKE